MRNGGNTALRMADDGHLNSGIFTFGKLSFILERSMLFYQLPVFVNSLRFLQKTIENVSVSRFRHTNKARRQQNWKSL